MFDDPKKELKRLEDQLLAAEEEQWETPMEPAEPEEDYPEAAGGRFLRVEPSPEPEEEDPPEQRNRVPILVAALLLEVAALFGVLAWWLLWR